MIVIQNDCFLCKNLHNDIALFKLTRAVPEGVLAVLV